MPHSSRPRDTALIGLALAAAPALAQPSGINAPSEFGPGLGLLLVYVLLALFFSFLCSVAEAVLLSITPSYIAELRKRDPKQADRLQALKGEGIDHRRRWQRARIPAVADRLRRLLHVVTAVPARSPPRCGPHPSSCSPCSPC